MNIESYNLSEKSEKLIDDFFTFFDRASQINMSENIGAIPDHFENLFPEIKKDTKFLIKQKFLFKMTYKLLFETSENGIFKENCVPVMNMGQSLIFKEIEDYQGVTLLCEDGKSRLILIKSRNEQHDPVLKITKNALKRIVSNNQEEFVFLTVPKMTCSFWTYILDIIEPEKHKTSFFCLMSALEMNSEKFSKPLRIEPKFTKITFDDNFLFLVVDENKNIEYASHIISLS